MKKICSLITFILIIYMIPINVFAIEDEIKIENFKIYSPLTNAIYFDEGFDIVISNIDTEYMIKDVTASINNKIIELKYDSKVNWGKGGWCGKFELYDIDRGEKELIIIATDIKGNKFYNRKKIIHTNQPNLDVIYPQDKTIVNEKMWIYVKANDNKNEDCKINVYKNIDNSRELIYSGVNIIDTNILVGIYNGKNLELIFETINETGGKYEKKLTVGIETSNNVSLLETIDGEIISCKDGKVLYTDANKNKLVVKDLKENIEREIDSIITTQKINGIVRDDKIVYSIDNNLYVHQNNESKLIGEVEDFKNVKFSGKYVAWKGKRIGDYSIKQYKYDVEKNIYTTLNNNNIYNISESGRVIYYTMIELPSPAYIEVYEYEFFEYTNNEKKVLYSGLGNPELLISNNNILFYDDRKLYINIDGKNVLVNESDYNLQRGSNYSINGDIIAYTKKINGSSQIFIQKNNDTRQVTYWNSGSFIKLLNSNGDLVLKNGEKYYYYNYAVDKITPIYNYNFNIFFGNDRLYAKQEKDIYKISLEEIVNEDVNSDGEVNLLDLAIIATKYNQIQEYSKYDLNRDMIIDILDLVLVSKKCN